MSADFEPTIPGISINPLPNTESSISVQRTTYNQTGSFRFWCQKVLPLVYDDSLSYYELLCKVVNYLNTVIQNVDSLHDENTNTINAFSALQTFVNTNDAAMTAFINNADSQMVNYINDSMDSLVTTYNQLQDFVNDYFDNLDVQEEINNKLDAMAASGALGNVLEPYIANYQSQLDLLVQRVNNLESNYTPGGTTADTELADIRVPFAGATYDTAGNAVRGQAAILNKINTLGLEGYHPLTLEWENGTIDTSTGVEQTTAQQVRTKYILQFEKETEIIRIGTGFYGYIILYNDDGTFKSSYLFSGATSIPPNWKFRVTARLSALANIGPLAFYDRIVIYSDIGLQNRIYKDAVKRIIYNGEQTAYSADFYHGNLSQGNYYPNSNFRIHSGLMYSHTPIKMAIDSGYRAAISYYNSEGTYSSETGFFEGYAVVPAGRYYKLLIAKNPDVSGTCDLDDLKNSVHFIPHTSNVDSVYTALKSFYNGRMRLNAHLGLYPTDETSDIVPQSVAAYRYAGEKHMWSCEADLRTTSDGYIVCHHNDSLSDTTGSGNISEKTLEEVRSVYLKKLDGSASTEKIPTLEEFLLICKQYNMVANMEFKSATFTDVKTAVKKYGMLNQYIITGNRTLMEIIRKQDIEVPFILIESTSSFSSDVLYAESRQPVIIAMDYTTANLSTYVDAAHNVGIPFVAYTIESKSNIANMFNIGVDIVTTGTVDEEIYNS